MAAPSPASSNNGETESTPTETFSSDAAGKGFARQDDRHLAVARTTFRPSTDSFFSEQSLYSGRMVSNADSSQPLLRSPSPAYSSIEPCSQPPPQTWRTKLWALWLQSKGMVLVMLSQFFGATMNVMTQVLELDGSHGPGMHPFQILFARMSITVVFSYLYMWYTKVPEAFGNREILWPLILRAVGGFFGVFGLYYSVQYMPLSEATVITFLAPMLTCYACSFLIPNETFTRKQQLAGLISLLGVVLIARPFSASGPPGQPTTDAVSADKEGPDSADAHGHFVAIIVALVGVVGAACAYTGIRIVGTRAHALVTVTYFSVFTTLVSVVAMVAIPSVPFRLPSNFTEWILLLGLGVCGFILQFLLTAGLAYVPPPPPGQSARTAKSSSHGSRATSMVYTQMLFALFYDRLVWGSTLSAISWAGSGLILGSAIYVAVVRDGRGSRAHEGEHGVDADAGPVITVVQVKDNDVTGQERRLEEGESTGLS